MECILYEKIFNASLVIKPCKNDLESYLIVFLLLQLYVSDTDKTENYWAKRVTNNVAARRSREARRLKVSLRTKKN